MKTSKLTAQERQALKKPIDGGYVEIEFPEQHDLEKFIEETDEYLIDSFTCFHKPSERTFILSYLSSEVTPVLNEAGNVLLQVDFGGAFDESFRIQNKVEFGGELAEITTEFMTESIVVSFAAARKDVDGEIDAHCILRKMMVENIPIELDDHLDNGWEIEIDFEKLEEERRAKRAAELSSKYLVIDAFSEELTLVCAGGKEGFINKEGEMVGEPQFDKVYALSDGLARVQIGNKWGFLNAQGELVIKAQYNEAYPFYDGVAAVKKGKKWGMINQKGKAVVGFEYDEINEFFDGLAVILKITPQKGYQYGYINTQGQVIVEPQYRRAYPFSGGHAVVFNDNLSDYVWQLIDTKGMVVKDFSPEFDFFYEFSEGLAIFEMKVDDCRKSGFIDTEGNVVSEAKYDFAFAFQNGMAKVGFKQNGEDMMGVINRHGKLVAEPQYDFIYDFNQGLAAVCKDDKYGFIDEDGQLIIEPQFSSLGRLNQFSEGLAVVEQDEKYGYIDKTGVMVIPPRFGFALDFMEGMAGIYLNRLAGFIDRDGQIVIEPQFNSIIEGFIDGVAWVELQDGLNVYINKKGEILAVANGKQRKLTP